MRVIKEKFRADEAFKLGAHDYQNAKVYNPYNYTIQELRIDNKNKTFERGDFTMGSPDKKFKSKQAYEDLVDELIDKGYKEIPSDYKSLRNKSRKGIKIIESVDNGPLGDSVKEWYKEAFPTDELGNGIKDGITFGDIYNNLTKDGVFSYSWVAGDSTIRERIFSELADRTKKPYDVIYSAWLDSEEPYKKVERAKNAYRRGQITHAEYMKVSNKHSVKEEAESKERKDKKMKKKMDEDFFYEDGDTVVFYGKRMTVDEFEKYAADLVLSHLPVVEITENDIATWEEY